MVVRVIDAGVLAIGNPDEGIDSDALRLGSVLISRDLAELLPRELVLPLIVRHAVGLLDGGADEWREQRDIARSGEPWAEGAEIRSRFIPAPPTEEGVREGGRVFADNLRRVLPEEAEEAGEEAVQRASEIAHATMMLRVVERGGVCISTSEESGRTAVLLEDQMLRGDRVPELRIVGACRLAEAASSLGFDVEEVSGLPGEEEEEKRGD